MLIKHDCKTIFFLLQNINKNCQDLWKLDSYQQHKFQNKQLAKRNIVYLTTMWHHLQCNECTSLMWNKTFNRASTQNSKVVWHRPLQTLFPSLPWVNICPIVCQSEVGAANTVCKCDPFTEFNRTFLTFYTQSVILDTMCNFCTICKKNENLSITNEQKIIVNF